MYNTSLLLLRAVNNNRARVLFIGHLPWGPTQWAHGLLVPCPQPGEDAVHVKGMLALAHYGGAILPRELARGAA